MLREAWLRSPNLAVDNFDKHIEDTMIAGDWLSDPEAVRKVVTNAPSQINELIKVGRRLRQERKRRL